MTGFFCTVTEAEAHQCCCIFNHLPCETDGKHDFSETSEPLMRAIGNSQWVYSEGLSIRGCVRLSRHFKEQGRKTSIVIYYSTFSFIFFNDDESLIFKNNSITITFNELNKQAPSVRSFFMSTPHKADE